MLGTANSQSTTNGGCLQEQVTGYTRWFYPVVVWRDTAGLPR